MRSVDGCQQKHVCILTIETATQDIWKIDAYAGWGLMGKMGWEMNHGTKKLWPLSTLRSDKGTLPRDGNGVV